MKNLLTWFVLISTAVTGVAFAQPGVEGVYAKAPYQEAKA